MGAGVQCTPAPMRSTLSVRYGLGARLIGTSVRAVDVTVHAAGEPAAPVAAHAPPQLTNREPAAVWKRSDTEVPRSTTKRKVADGVFVSILMTTFLLSG